MSLPPIQPTGHAPPGPPPPPRQYDFKLESRKLVDFTNNLFKLVDESKLLLVDSSRLSSETQAFQKEFRRFKIRNQILQITNKGLAKGDSEKQKYLDDVQRVIRPYHPPSDREGTLPNQQADAINNDELTRESVVDIEENMHNGVQLDTPSNNLNSAAGSINKRKNSFDEESKKKKSHSEGESQDRDLNDNLSKVGEFSENYYSTLQQGISEEDNDDSYDPAEDEDVDVSDNGNSNGNANLNEPILENEVANESETNNHNPILSSEESRSNESLHASKGQTSSNNSTNQKSLPTIPSSSAQGYYYENSNHNRNRSSEQYHQQRKRPHQSKSQPQSQSQFPPQPQFQFQIPLPGYPNTNLPFSVNSSQSILPPTSRMRNRQDRSDLRYPQPSPIPHLPHSSHLGFPAPSHTGFLPEFPPGVAPPPGFQPFQPLPNNLRDMPPFMNGFQYPIGGSPPIPNQHGNFLPYPPPPIPNGSSANHHRREPHRKHRLPPRASISDNSDLNRYGTPEFGDMY